MAAIVNSAEVTSTRESDRQLALLNWARTKIELIATRSDPGDSLDDLLDFAGHFTREYFGYQERLLKEAAAHHEHLMERTGTHNEFRRRLARVCADAANGDATVAKRLNALCHELWLDVQTQRDDS
jgi:hemerythrin